MIFRRRHTANFTTIGNGLFDDERLKLDELGVLTFLLSRPENWEVRRPHLRKRFKIGRDALRRIVTNLVKFGWATACRKRLSNGTFYTIYEIRDECGPELTDEEVKNIFLLDSGGDVPSDDVEGDAETHEEEADDQGGLVAMECGLPAVQGGLPATANPPRPLYKTLTNTEATKSEREHAREKEKHALNLAEFKRRYPTAASDDQAKIDEAWFHLEFDEGEAALAGIVPFLDKLKRDKRTTVPAGWKYLKEKRWTLLPEASGTVVPIGGHPPDSPQARAVAMAHEICRTTPFFRTVLAKHGPVHYRHPITPRLLALTQAPRRDDWPVLTRQQAGAWEAFLREVVTVQTRRPLREGDIAPWPWPPRVDGTLSPDTTDPPSSDLGDDDAAHLR